ncbi:hypothetical protein [Streptomyces fuscigenes]|uniref:hypothetical protein n=1 Tax=Streptomyces fuscigenes TaxID=1528880 RepID=UPI001F3D4B4D|nr:hypothetical protein [Streptomyces fuscigenes]MCF3960311.1 hypothetical protein [Streptomyces fuscigenes]
MPNSPAEREPAPGLTLVQIPDMPDHLEEAGLKRLTPARLRQLAAEDVTFPAPVYQRGQVRIWDMRDVVQYLQSRVLRQGERTDLSAKRPGEE